MRGGALVWMAVGFVRRYRRRFGGVGVCLCECG